MPKTLQTSLIALAAALLLGGCSVLSPIPLWELAKAGSSAAVYSAAENGTSASDTVQHNFAAFKQMCIEYNENIQLIDLIPALQAEFQSHGIESRVYPPGSTQPACNIWLRYTADLRWDIPLFGGDYKPYLNRAALTLRSERGTVLASSAYTVDDYLELGKWASTRSKLAPVVSALLTPVAH
ncbi:cell division protein FtsI [Roseateles koreensis]|uniref:Cell division protein FtsI n=1 Tax=Roseateles koreensis TaxID=2987526 RepID=A0ABT5KLS3_9BURK|nr:cell division protein FtsI [Roseateles koreensis]MDC8783859.1 cell division protein FtsI [Roseateles koreensis]